MTPEECAAVAEGHHAVTPDEREWLMATAGHLRRLAALERVLVGNLEIAPAPVHDGTWEAEAWDEDSEVTRFGSGDTPLAALLALADALEAKDV